MGAGSESWPVSSSSRAGTKPSGRLLNEFLISLGLFFLILTANLTVLNSASRSSAQAGATRQALDLARDGLEEAIAAPTPGLREVNFGSRGKETNGFTFNRRVKVVPLAGPQQGLALATVTVDWGQGRTVSLERYVWRL